MMALIRIILLSHARRKRWHVRHIYVDVDVQVLLRSMRMTCDSAHQWRIVWLVAFVPLCTVVLVIVAILLVASILVVGIVILFVWISEVLVLVICLMAWRLVTVRMLLKSTLLSSVVRELVLWVLLWPSSVLLVLAETVICEILIFLWVIWSLASWSFELRILLDKSLVYF